ncbi:MAG: thiazole synthase [Victivallales bacterium]|nr:thiazole synthase [Victivallales bacterium]
MKELRIAGKVFSSRLFLGTGKFSSPEVLARTIKVSGTELVTVALKRVTPEDPSDGILSAIGDSARIMLNTSGARNAAEAVKIAKFAKAVGIDWIKLEIHPEPHYLLPDPVETLAAAEQIVKEGMVVLPYINADPVLAKRLEDVGVHAVMPLGSPIGSNRGLRTRDMLEIIIAQSLVPVVVDAGIGLPSHAAEAIEIGADAVLVNTAIAAAENPPLMAEAFAMAVSSAVKALDALPPSAIMKASPSSPSSLF